MTKAIGNHVPPPWQLVEIIQELEKALQDALAKVNHPRDEEDDQPISDEHDDHSAFRCDPSAFMRR